MTAVWLAVMSLSPARSASLLNNTIRISPAFHSVSPDVRFSARPPLDDLHVTKPVDVATPKLMTRKHSVNGFHFTKHLDKSSPKLMTRKHSVSGFHFTKHVDKSSSKLMMEATPSPPAGPVPVPYPNAGTAR